MVFRSAIITSERPLPSGTRIISKPFFAAPTQINPSVGSSAHRGRLPRRPQVSIRKTICWNFIKIAICSNIFQTHGEGFRKCERGSLFFDFEAISNEFRRFFKSVQIDFEGISKVFQMTRKSHFQALSLTQCMAIVERRGWPSWIVCLGCEQSLLVKLLRVCRQDDA